jgi:hypothetical protein
MDWAHAANWRQLVAIKFVLAQTFFVCLVLGELNCTVAIVWLLDLDII